MEVKSNSQLQSVPEEYCPLGSGNWFRIHEGYDAGKTLFYYDYDVGNKPPQSTVLFVHGNPECSYTYRHIRDELLRYGAPLRLIGIDHIGFGISDQASYEMVDMHHSANLSQLIQHLDLQDVTLVIHDWGGPIGIGAFAGEMDRVTSLVVLNSTIFPMPPDGFTYGNWPLSWLPWCRFPSLTPNFFWGGLAGRIILNSNRAHIIFMLLKTYIFQLRFACHLIPKGSPEWIFSESLRSKTNALSSKRNVLQTPVWGYGYSYSDPVVGHQNNQTYYQDMQSMVPSAWGIGGANIPVSGHFGTYDPLGKNSVIQQWSEVLPRMADDTHVYEDYGHFIEEHKGPEIAASILRLNGLSA